MSETEIKCEPEREWVAIIARIYPQGYKWSAKKQGTEQFYLLEPIGTVTKPEKNKPEKVESGRLF